MFCCVSEGKTTVSLDLLINRTNKQCINYHTKNDIYISSYIFMSGLWKIPVFNFHTYSVSKKSLHRRKNKRKM